MFLRTQQLLFLNSLAYKLIGDVEYKQHNQTTCFAIFKLNPQLLKIKWD